MTQRALFLALCATLSVADAATGAAQQVVYVQPAVQNPNTHSGGFFGRFQLGFAYSYTSYPDIDVTWAGGAVDLSLSLGFSLPSSVALHVDFLADVAFEPEVRTGGTTGTATDTTYSTTGFGLGVTRYFVTNAFLTGGLGFARANLTDSFGTDYTSDLGGYLTFGAGREWWLAPRLGAGVYGRITLFRLPDAGVDSSFTTIVPSVGFTMTVD